MSNRVHQWNAGQVTIQPPEGAPEGCIPCVLDIGTVTVSWEVADAFDLAAVKLSKQVSLDLWWSTYQGIEITLADQSVIHVPILFELVSFNASIVSLALLMQSDAIISGNGRVPITIPAAEVVVVFGAFQAGYQALLATYTSVKAAIDAATDETSINAVAIPS